MDFNMTYLAKIHFAWTQIESGPNMSSKGHAVFMVYYLAKPCGNFALKTISNFLNALQM